MKSEQLSHLSNLIALAYADGRLDITEKELLFKIGDQMGLSKNEVEEKIINAEEVDFIFPEKETVRYQQLYDLIEMMTIDGHIHDNEVVLLKKYATRLNFKSEMIDPLISKIKEYLNLGYNHNRIHDDLGSLINKI